jgi:DNA-binding CsgD family transcriptional regulator
VHPDLPLKLVIADGTTAIIPFSLAPGGHATAYLIHRSPLLFALECLFESYWTRSAPILGDDNGAQAQPAPAQTAQSPAPQACEDAGTQDAAGANPTAANDADECPDEETRMLLALLAGGLTDKSIGRAMAWSERTTQRRIQQLMVRVGAVTRFQASLMAARRGWL